MTFKELTAYLQKIKILYRSLCDLSTEDRIRYLNDIYFAHVTSFPYYNFELRKIAREHPIRRPSLSFFSDSFGGYCFQSAGLLGAALKALNLLFIILPLHNLTIILVKLCWLNPK